MRKSKSRSKARVAAAAGLTTGAVGAALLVAPSAAFAAVTVSPPVVGVGGRVTVVDTDGVTLTTGSNTTANRVFVLTAPGTVAPVCASTLPVASATVLAATQTGVTSSDVTKTVSFDSPAGATAGTNGQAKRYVACFYDDDTSARQGNQNGYSFYVGTVPALNPAVGLTGGGNTVGITTATNVFTGIATIGAQFVTDNCPTTFGAPAAGVAATVTKTGDAAASVVVPASVTSTTAVPTKYNLCFYNGVASTSPFVSGSVYTASQLALSQTVGPYGGGNNIDVTSPEPFLAGLDAPGVLFTAAACPAEYDDDTAEVPAAADRIRKVTNNRLAVTVPSGAADPGTTLAPWNLCIYQNSTDDGGAPGVVSALVASYPYRVTTVQTAVGISPKAGPSLGGSIITVTGTAFPTEPGSITATLGGVPLTEITPISATAFTARTPQRAPANGVALVTTTAGGSHTLLNAYSFTSALVANPKTAPNTRAIDVIVNGIGFESAAWSATVGTGAHIFLVKGNYSSAAVNGAAYRANPAVADCGKVLVLSDSELVCRLDLTKRLDTAGETVLRAAPKYGAAIDFKITTGSRVLTAGAATTFDQSDVGKAVIDTAATPLIPAGTVISAVYSDTEAIMSNPASGTVSANDNTTITVAGSTDTKVVAVTTNIGGGTEMNLAGITPVLTSATDAGKFIAGTGIPAAGTTVYTIAGGGATAVMRNTANSADVVATAAGTVNAVISSGYTVVPEGAYNLQYVSNAALNAVHVDPSYVQSSVSSASTFTVSSF
ncbi:IPT/TIG domain-containing protein [Actinoplanes xinjiangensis]|uniref:IPT/TIG domain-containing protein n=1 Tax=Actinoplanes xinjiangensis TaxID=512350 RepID=UPI0034405768